MKRILNIFLSLFISWPLLAGKYDWQANVDTVKKEGFHRIQLSPDITGHMNAGFSDVRLYDEGRETPYLMEKESRAEWHRIFKDYEIISKQHHRMGTVIVIRNPNKDRKINNLSLLVKNFNVRKRLELAGSDDREMWYAIKEDYVFWEANHPKECQEIKVLNFPWVDYEYYRIIIYDWFSEPINILSAGYYDTYSELGKYTRVPQPEITQKDTSELRETHVYFNFDDPAYFDQLEFGISGPKYYQREARICTVHKDKRDRVYFMPIEYLTLSSNRENKIQFDRFKHKQFVLVIENNDNPPLKINSVDAYQLNNYITAWLEPNKSYLLAFGNEDARAPVYDIRFFTDSIPSNVATINTGEVMSAKEVAALTPPKVRKEWIWVTIIAVILLLGYMSLRMVGEMSKRETP